MAVATPTSTASDEIRLSVRKTRRDLQISLGLLIAGVALFVVFLGVEFWFNFSAASSDPAAYSALISALSGIASTFILVGGIFAFVNWSLLRRRRTSA